MQTSQHFQYECIDTLRMNMDTLLHTWLDQKFLDCCYSNKAKVSRVKSLGLELCRASTIYYNIIASDIYISVWRESVQNVIICEDRKSTSVTVACVAHFLVKESIQNRQTQYSNRCRCLKVFFKIQIPLERINISRCRGNPIECDDVGLRYLKKRSSGMLLSTESMPDKVCDFRKGLL